MRDGELNIAIFDTGVDDDAVPGPRIPAGGDPGCVGHGVHPGVFGVGPVELRVVVFGCGPVELHPGVVAGVAPGVGSVLRNHAQSATTESWRLWL